jgi:hypothetical protein
MQSAGLCGRLSREQDRCHPVEEQTMKMILWFVAFLFALSPIALAEQPVKGEIRNSSGRLLYKTVTRGNQTEVRSPTGKLLMKSKTTNSGTEARSQSGKLLFKSK